jgi:hypothetical protein
MNSITTIMNIHKIHTQSKPKYNFKNYIIELLNKSNKYYDEDILYLFDAIN